MNRAEWREWRSKLSRPAEKVAVGYLTRGDSTDAFSRSLQDTRDLDREKGVRRLGNGFDESWRITAQTGVNISRPRNKMCAKFLHLPHQPEWLWIIDDDMAWSPDALEILMASANPERIIGGLCFAWGPEGRVIPTIFDRDSSGRHQPVDEGYVIPDDALIQVSGTGAAFLLVHRDALIAIAKLTPTSPNPWFRELETEVVDIETGEVAPHWISEDLFFCDQAYRAGLSVWVHTGIEVKHRKALFLTRGLYEEAPKSLEWA